MLTPKKMQNCQTRNYHPTIILMNIAIAIQRKRMLQEVEVEIERKKEILPITILS
ncbi:MAG: hypothetical protein RI922_581 [Bacteroidota bacterium]|jgi:hypothetical protein